MRCTSPSASLMNVMASPTLHWPIEGVLGHQLGTQLIPVVSVRGLVLLLTRAVARLNIRNLGSLSSAMPSDCLGIAAALPLGVHLLLHERLRGVVGSRARHPLVRLRPIHRRGRSPEVHVRCFV